MNFKKVLHVGAHEELIMNYYRNFTSKNIIFDFVLRKDGVDFRFKNDPSFIGQIFYITPFNKSILKWMIELREIIKNNNYTHIHLHIGWANIFGLISCVGINTIKISHNHSFYTAKNIIFLLYRKIIKFFIWILSDINLACSTKSGKQMFAKNFILLPNAIDYKRFKFDPEIRKKIKSIMDIDDDTITYGHIGNFIDQKNHIFLIKIFSRIYKNNNKSRLYLIGADYGCMNEIKNLIFELKLVSNVFILGNRSDVNNIINIFDVFIFPSKTEGFGIALLEAQVNGIPCIYSSSIPNDAIISKYCISCELNQSEDIWANETIKLLDFGIDEMSRLKRIDELPSTFDVRLVSSQLENIYLRN